MSTGTVVDGGTDWKKMKVQELRDELASRGLDTSGLKATLIERLEAFSNHSDAEGKKSEKKEVDFDINEGMSLDGGSKVVSEQPGVEAEQTTGFQADESVEEEVLEVSTAPVQPASSLENNGRTSAPSSDFEKKQRRAERFGLELLVSEVEKRRLRAARFGSSPNGTTIPSNQEESKMSPTVKEAEAVKRKARAERFGIVEAAEGAASKDDTKKRARLARFGLDVKPDTQEVEKKKLRAARFGLDAEGKDNPGTHKKVTVELPIENSATI